MNVNSLLFLKWQLLFASDHMKNIEKGGFYSSAIGEPF